MSIIMDRRLLALVLIVAAALPVDAAVTPELQRQIRAGTFEVVMKKPSETSVAYEKPLPLELLPYVERTDAYRSVGTAFAIGPNSYVTAAHVLATGVGSQFGAPSIRTADGTVHPIASVEKYSASEDFAVFTVKDDLKPSPLPVNRSPRIDDAVLAVGNALGEGVVIRDGLFTSETPEEQEGRWKWIRFSAAASPGNSGGPLLDATGSVIGVVIRKSPNENLNYAAPIANVLDAPAHARFDGRAVTKLLFSPNSRTYVLKDEFALPLPWDGFVRAVEELTDRHNDKAREALLNAYAGTMFPKGGGTDSILYGPNVEGRDPAVVIQQADGDWSLHKPGLRTTDLPGDGKLGVGEIPGAALLTLHRGDKASDDAFYSDSRAFMDLALKALDLRRPIGSDAVKVISLGAATTDVTRQDLYGRRWQQRTWAFPSLDFHVIAELLPTPDGYVALIQYAPSQLLRECRIQLSMLANQVSPTYEGTIAQWRAFLARRALLPRSLEDVSVSSGAAWELHTRRFELRVPDTLMKLDAHSELVMTMNYAYDGPQVVWDIGGATWYRDLEEKAYVQFIRKPRPPVTAKLEMRTVFEEIHAARSPYDGFPARTSGDTFEASMGVQVPGSKAGMMSSDVAYVVSLRVDGAPALHEMVSRKAAALQALRILEHGVGQDVAAGVPASRNPEYDALLEKLKGQARTYDAYGSDLRNRHYSDDFEQYLLPMIAGADSAVAPRNASDFGELFDLAKDRDQALRAYWTAVSGLMHNRDLWKPFLEHNHQPPDTPHTAGVLAAESSLKDLLGNGQPPTPEWAARAHALDEAYIDERNQMARRISIPAIYRARQSACPEPTTQTSGHERPRPAPGSRAPEEYYPPSLRRLGIQGLVVVSVKVNRSGCATEFAVEASSGADELDEAAMKWVDTAAFLPAEKDHAPIDSTGPVAINFVLH